MNRKLVISEMGYQTLYFLTKFENERHEWFSEPGASPYSPEMFVERCIIEKHEDLVENKGVVFPPASKPLCRTQTAEQLDKLCKIVCENLVEPKWWNDICRNSQEPSNQTKKAET